MTEQVNFKLRASKIYFGLSILVHACTLIGIWLSSFNAYINLVLSAILTAHFQYLNAYIFLKKSNSILSFSLADRKLITTDKIGAQQKYPYIYCTYQSRFLVIITAGKRSLIIFKDSLDGHSVSQLNRLLNA